MKRNDKICILGSNGFVGKTLIERLRKDEYMELFTFDRKDVDLLDQYKTNGVLSYGFDYVFICSAVVGGIQANIENPYKFLYENLEIQNNVINACIKNKVKKVLNLASSCVFPKDYKQPLKEEYLMQAPLEPTNEGYALAKIASLKLCEYANKEFETRFISLMPANLYGPGDHFNLETSHVLSALVKKICDAKNNNEKSVEIWGTGEQRREFLYIDDLVNGMVWSMRHLNGHIPFINIGTGKDISIKELAYMIKDLTGYEGEFFFNTDKPDGMKQKVLDVSKINSIGWKYKTSLLEGLKKTIEYYEGKDKIS